LPEIVELSGSCSIQNHESINRFSSTLLSWGISGLEARWPHRLVACATGNLTK